jgi:histone H3/H4
LEENKNCWRHCGSCKKEIGYNSIYQVCNVSSCKKLVFCSVDCWDLHNPVMNHKSSWAEENRSPKYAETGTENSTGTPRRILINNSSSKIINENENEILIVASKLKQYIKDKHDMNTSANVMDVLSKYVRNISDRAALHAKSEGRKTLMDRDFE